MAVPSLRLILAACLVAALAGAANAQERGQFVPTKPSFGERLGNFFGGGNRENSRTRQQPREPQSGQVQQPRGGTAQPNPFAADRKFAPARPSQTNAPSAPQPSRSFGPNAANRTAEPTIAPQRPLDMQNLSPDQIQDDRLPTLSRRSAFSNAPQGSGEPPAGHRAFSAANPNAAPDAPAREQVTGPALGPRLTAPQSGDRSFATETAEPQFGAGSRRTPGRENQRLPAIEALPPATRQAPSFDTQPPASKVQQIINPTMRGDEPRGSFAREAESQIGTEPATGSVLRSDRPITNVMAPVADAAAQPSARLSSRRGFSGDSITSAASPSERIASIAALPERKASEFSAPAENVLFTRKSPLVSIETSGPRSIVVGKEATYVVSIRNSGEVAAQDVVVNVRVPQWADVASAKATTGSAELSQSAAFEAAPNSGITGGADQPVQWSISRLEAQKSEQLTLKIVPRSSKPFELAVQWTFMPISSHARVEVQEPKLVMSLSGPDEVLYGQTKVYKLTLSNPGTGAAENVAIQLAPLSDQPGPMTKHQVGTIAAGESKVIEVELTARQAGKVIIKALATADAGLQAAIDEEVVVRRAALGVQVAAAKVKYTGTIATYQIQVANPGNATAEQVQLTATLPANAKYLTSSAGGQANNEGTRVTWTVPSLRAGTDAVVELKCLLNNPGMNKLEVAAVAEGDLTAAGEATTQVEALADLKLDVVEPKGPIAVGEEVTYELRVSNRGTKSAGDVRVIGYFSEEIDPVSASGGPNQVTRGMVIFKPIMNLAAGTEASFKIKARAKREGSHMFRAEVICEAVGAKLGSEHTTLFYGDDSARTLASEAQATDDIEKPLAPKAVFGDDSEKLNAPHSDASGSNGFDPGRQSPAKGSAYAPAAKGSTFTPVDPFSNSKGVANMPATLRPAVQR